MIVVTVSGNLRPSGPIKSVSLPNFFYFQVSRENLRKIVGENAADEYIDQLIAEVDLEKDGKISYSEFLEAFSRRNQDNVYNMYELEREDSMDESPDSDEEVLRSFGIIQKIRRAFNSTENLDRNSKRTNAT